MKIGLSTSCFYPLLTENSLYSVCSHGVTDTEIFFNAYCESEPAFVKQLIDIKNRYGVNVLSVHPTMSLAESFVLFSAYERRYLEGLERYKRYAEIVCEMGGKYIILHGGKPNNVLDNRGYFERFAVLSNELKREGAILLQENVVKYRAGNLDVLKQMREYLGSEAAFCLDIKQSIRGGYSPFDAADVLGNAVKHVHISDNTPENDCMLPFKGTFDFDGFFKKLKQNGFTGDAVIEVYSSAFGSEEELFSSYKKLKEKNF